MGTKNIVSINRVKIDRKNFTTPLNPVIFILSIVKSFDMLLKYGA